MRTSSSKPKKTELRRIGPLCLLWLAACSSASLTSPDREGFSVTLSPAPGIVLSTRPDVRADQVAGRAVRSREAVHAFFAAFAPDPGRPRVRIVVYRDAADYETHAPPGPDSLARYDALHRELHITADAPLSSWRHEWAHVFLEDLHPSSPLWLHEGLALFLEDFAGFVPPASPRLHCSVPLRTALPSRIEAVRGRLIQYVRASSRSLHEDLEGPHAVPLSAYLIFFVWHERELGKLLQRRLSPQRVTPEQSLLIDDAAEFEKRFRAWLSSRASIGARPGC